jgi:hypothetical protein
VPQCRVCGGLVPTAPVCPSHSEAPRPHSRAHAFPLRAPGRFSRRLRVEQRRTATKPGQTSAVDNAVDPVGMDRGVVVDEAFTVLWMMCERQANRASDLCCGRPPPVEERKMLRRSPGWAVRFRSWQSNPAQQALTAQASDKTRHPGRYPGSWFGEARSAGARCPHTATASALSSSFRHG